MGLSVYQKYRLLEQSGDKFKNNEHRKLLRSKVLIDDNVAANYNKAFGISGIIFELDKEATKELSKPKTPVKKDNDKVKEEREALKAEATELGLDFAGNISNGKLIELINEAKNK